MGVILREGGKWRKVSNGAADEAARRKDCACAEMASCWKAARGAPSTLAVLHQSSLLPSADSSAPLRLLTDTCALLLTSSKWERLQKAPRKFGKRSESNHSPFPSCISVFSFSQFMMCNWSEMRHDSWSRRLAAWSFGGRVFSVIRFHQSTEEKSYKGLTVKSLLH